MRQKENKSGSVQLAKTPEKQDPTGPPRPMNPTVTVKLGPGD